MSRCDNGLEHISGAMVARTEKKDIKIANIKPGSPQKTTYIEHYNHTAHCDWLAHYLFESIEEVQE